MFTNMRVVDLTQPLDPATVMWPGAPAPTAETILTVAHDGFYNRRVSFMEHSGTHFDAPCHMVDGTQSVDQIPAASLVRPVAMVDISEACAGMTRRRAHPRAGPGVRGASRPDPRWRRRPPPDWLGGVQHGMRGDTPSVLLRFPGFGPEAARFLVEERNAGGLGVDTLGIDPGVATDFVVHRQITHPRGIWHLEGLTNLAQLPPLGAWVVVGVLRLTDGSGSPARVIALVP